VAILTSDMRRVVLEQRLGFAATTCPDGTPNLSPKGTTTVWDDDHLMFADLASPGTVANLRANPAIEINVVDPIVRKGYRFKGRARVLDSGPEYEDGLRRLAERGLSSRPERVRAVVVVAVERAEALVSPAYQPGVSEEEVAAEWARRIAARLDRARPSPSAGD
jgi:predicted pyridoxine 5'-phosphate oxidase superfamily flavin-nucleotide-binding protein